MSAETDAKPLTTAEVLALPEHGDEDGGMPGVVLVDRDELLATTRALETAHTALETALEWMEGRFGNTDGLDWGDESAAAVADALDAALARNGRAP